MSKEITYRTMPKFNKWKSDSAVKSWLFKRSSDPVLKRLDRLMKNQVGTLDDGGAEYYMCEIHSAADFWLQNFNRTAYMHAEREPAIRALFELTETRLAGFFKCNPRMVGAELQKYFGTSLTPHGIYCDRQDSSYFKDQARRDPYRVFFNKSGKAQWHPSWSPGHSKVILVDTKLAYERTYKELKDEGGGSLKEDWSYFVMGWQRQIYVAPHQPKSNITPNFHSSILSGQPVQFAGSILIRKGVVLAIGSDSGHYKPDRLFFVNILEHLKTVGVNLKKVELYSHDGDLILDKSGEPYRADRYLEDRGTWENVQARRELNLEHRSATASALRGKIFWQRMDQKKVKIEAIFLERYEVLQKTRPATGELWKEAWNGVLIDLETFDTDNNILKFKSLALKWRNSPPQMPRVSDQTQDQEESHADKFRRIRDAFDTGTITNS